MTDNDPAYRALDNAKQWKSRNLDKQREYRRRYIERHPDRVAAQTAAQRVSRHRLAAASAAVEAVRACVLTDNTNLPLDEWAKLVATLHEKIAAWDALRKGD